MKRLIANSLFAGLMSLAAVCSAADISIHSSAGCAFPDTGQGMSYTGTFGEDNDYSSSVSMRSFTIYNPVGASSVTVDNRTGLMWVTNSVDAGISGNYNWENAITACEGLSYAGYTDWRLPNIKELVSIVDFSRPAPAINAAYFLNWQSTYYLSSTTYVPLTANALGVYIGDGTTFNAPKTNMGRAWCVRGGP